MSGVVFPAKALKGLSFTIADLTLVNAWSKARSLNMIVRLDHGSDTDEYEEVLAFHPANGTPGKSPLCRWMMWRNADGVFVQPLLGRCRRYATVADAIDDLAIHQHVVLTDINASHWPHEI